MMKSTNGYNSNPVLRKWKIPPVKTELIRNFFWIIFFILLIYNLHPASAESIQQPVPNQVLIVHSAYLGYPWTDSLNRGIHSVFDSSSVLIDLRFEYIDTKRHREKDYFKRLRELWNIKYKNRRIDLILVCDNEAYNFVLQERNDLFRDVPIVFAAYIGFTPDMLVGQQPITGVVQETDIAATIDLALRLHPRTRKIVFVAPGAPPFRMVWLDGLAERYAKQVQLVTITAETVPLIDKEIDALGLNIVLIPLNSVLETDGAYFPFDQFVAHLSVARPFPVYALWDIALGHGVVGGKMVTGKSQGEKASKLALQILQGTPVKDVPVVTDSPNQYMFDWTAMQRFKIRDSALPKESILINRPVSFYEANKTIVQVTLTVIFVLLLLVFSLIFTVAHLRSAQKDLLFSKKTLSASEARFKKLIQKSPLPIVITDPSQNITLFNDKFTELFGYTINDVHTAEKWWRIAYPDEEYRKKVQNSWLTAIEKASSTGSDIAMQEWDLTIKDGTKRKCEFFMVPMHEVSLIIMNDITERKKTEAERKQLELRLQQSQKMEAIGVLAGGIAHDFNNILSVILGYTELAREACLPGSTIIQDLNMVMDAGGRAKSLVQQILAFSHQTNTERKPLQPAMIVKEAIKMLRPTLPTTIDICLDIDGATSQVLADPTKLNQILMNLCTNAFHAMENTGGKLGILLKETDLSVEDLSHEPDIDAGTFVQLTVSDSGIGIDPKIISNIYLPYFTTKETGKGTGMGLSIVHGIVKSYGGFSTVTSEPGEGTVFNVFLPAIKNYAETAVKTSEYCPTGTERILYIDDEAMIARMGKKILEQLGYQVTTQNSSLAGLELFQKQPDYFDLIITDQTMPDMTGADIAQRMIQIRPDIPIILCTGYSSVISAEEAKSIGIKEFALKPVTRETLARLVRKVLDNAGCRKC